MSGMSSETDESDWTKADLQKLLAAMKTSIPEHKRMSAYTKGLKTIDWNKVAFPPFSPEECQKKWRTILQTMRKARTLTELIIEAEDVLSNPVQNNKQGEQHTEDAEGLPPKPPLNGYNLFCKEQLTSMAGVSRNAYVSVWAKRWRNLTETQRNEYGTRCRELKKQYAIKLDEYLMTLDEEEQQRILNKHGIKRPKAIKREVKPVKKHPDEPKMPSRSGNVIFCKEQMERLKKKFPNSRERFIKVQQMWNGLPLKEKKRYQDKVNKNTEKYSMQLQKWFKTLTPAEQINYRKRNSSKCQYLDAEQMDVYDREEEVCLYRPSDSEDEDTEDSSSEEEANNLACEEDEEEEEGDVIMFEMY